MFPLTMAAEPLPKTMPVVKAIKRIRTPPPTRSKTDVMKEKKKRLSNSARKGPNFPSEFDPTVAAAAEPVSAVEPPKKYKSKKAKKSKESKADGEAPSSADSEAPVVAAEAAEAEAAATRAPGAAKAQAGKDVTEGGDDGTPKKKKSGRKGRGKNPEE